MAAARGMQAAVEKTVVEAAKVLESELDVELEKLDNMDSDGLEKLRYAILIEITYSGTPQWDTSTLH